MKVKKLGQIIEDMIEEKEESADFKRRLAQSEAKTAAKDEVADELRRTL